MPAIEGKLDASGKRFAIVVSRFNAFITERLLLSACDGLLRSGAQEKDIDVVRVPERLRFPRRRGLWLKPGSMTRSSASAAYCAATRRITT